MSVVGLASLYGDPIHSGHIDYLEAARSKCDHLIVIVNNDNQVKIKGSVPFLDEKTRARIVGALRCVDEVYLSIDQDSSVAASIEQVIASFLLLGGFRFALFNSGDRNPNNQNSKESEVCKRWDIKEVFLDLPKVNSSSALKRAISTHT